MSSYAYHTIRVYEASSLSHSGIELRLKRKKKNQLRITILSNKKKYKREPKSEKNRL